ncbi:hypothetical protein KC345_g9595 [Hortaea werneckii]|nr:hypothetical protein KC345_g9595 [Hortaea werneckii]
MPVSALVAFGRTAARHVNLQTCPQNLRRQQANLDAALPGQGSGDADGADHHMPGGFRAGILQQPAFEKREADRHRRMNARLMRLPRVRVQPARDVRGHNWFAAGVRSGNQLRIGTARGSRAACAEQRINDAAACGKVQPVPAVDYGRQAHGCSGIALQGGFAGQRLRRGRVDQRDGDAGLTQVPGGGDPVAAVVPFAGEDEPVLAAGMGKRQRSVGTDREARRRHRRAAACALSIQAPNAPRFPVSSAISPAPPAQGNDLLRNSPSGVLHQRNRRNAQPFDGLTIQSAHLLRSHHIHSLTPLDASIVLSPVGSSKP